MAQEREEESSDQQRISWVFTVNNYTDHCVAVMKDPKFLEAIGGSYIFYGQEVAPSTGTPHLQGYLETKKVRRRTLRKRVHELTGCSPYLAPAFGTKSENVAYCEKQGGVIVEIGQARPDKKAKKKGNLQLIIEDINNGERNERELWSKHPQGMVLHHRGVRELLKMTKVKLENLPFPLSSFATSWRIQLSTWMPMKRCAIVWGPSGVGKTTFCRALMPKALIVSHLDDLRDLNTEEHEGIIFDDMDFKHLPRTSQIHLCDVEMGRSIYTRYQNAYIPAGFPRMFTTNTYEGAIFIHDPAIQRRVHIFPIK